MLEVALAVAVEAVVAELMFVVGDPLETLSRWR